MNDPARQPAFNIPTAVLGAGLAMTCVHLLRLTLPEEQGFELLITLAFIPARYAGEVTGIPGGDWSTLTSFVTYMLVHGDWTHLLINLMWMVAFGSAVAKRIGNTRFLVFSIVCGIAGVLLHLLLHFGEAIPVVGASAAISGQMAGAMRFIFSMRQAFGGFHQDFTQVPLSSIPQTLTNPKFLAFLAVWLGLNLLFGLGGVQLEASSSSIAWEAHIGGFLCGLFLFGLFDRRQFYQI